MDPGPAADPIVRQTPCPACGHPVGFTAAQLDDKRAPCGACAAAVELDDGSPLTDAGAAPPVALAQVLALRPRTAPLVYRTTPFTLSVRAPGRPIASGLALVVAVILTGVLSTVTSLQAVFSIAPLAITLYIIGLRTMPRQSTLIATPRRLVVRSAFRRRELTITAPLLLGHDGRDLVVVSGDAAVALPRIALAPDDRRWLRDALRAATAPVVAPAADPPAADPTAADPRPAKARS